LLDELPDDLLPLADPLLLDSLLPPEEEAVLPPLLAPPSSERLSSITSAGMPRPKPTTRAPMTSAEPGRRRRRRAPTKRATPTSVSTPKVLKAGAY
jgi:hypothetical protein